MKKNEKIIVTLTSWKKRLGNLPTVLGTILNQTLKPDKIVLNLSVEEFPKKEKEIPSDVFDFLKTNNIEIYWVPGKNTKQWKKIIPTLLRYPKDAIICIDDDFKYPSDLVETLYNKHLECPNNPISGNKVKMFGIKCHCGCASLLVGEFFVNLQDYLQDDEIYNLYSSDIFFSYVAEKSGHPYVYAEKEFFYNMKKYNAVDALSGHRISKRNPIKETWDWMCNKYGKIGRNASLHNLEKPKIRTEKAQQELLSAIREDIKLPTNNSASGKPGIKKHPTIVDIDAIKKKYLRHTGNIITREEKSVTFIIVNRGGKELNRVIRNFEKTFKDYFSDVRFIVVEQYDELPFKRGQLYNIGVKYCNTEYIGLIDNDIINLDTFDPIAKYKELGGPYVPFDAITQIRYTDDENYKITSSMHLLAHGAFNFMKKEDFIKVNGFSNLFFAWGAEDDLFDLKIKLKRFKHSLGHITHPRRSLKEADCTRNNREIYRKYKNGKIDWMSDGYLQTIFDMVSDTSEGNTRYIKVNNIGVVSDFKYMDEYNNAKKIENKYIVKK